MSLKAFHIAFVTASVLLMLMIAGWCFGNYREGGASPDIVWGVAALIAAAGLIAYGRFFLRKLKHISFL